jgi:aspartyl-tRNA(Asn)/glutamyl-tRNA(Gln) amidotransferase subunit A
MDALLDADIKSVAAQIKSRDVSPVEVTKAALERIETTEGRLNAYVVVTADRALADARQAEREIQLGRYRGALHGIPVGIKDLYDIAGMATTCSSRVRHDHRAESDSACVERLRAAGAVIVGKTHTHEFAYGIITPTTSNPWNTDYIPGGSSGGSGASVAARGCFMAMGTDTGGSIRIPAALCGVTGLKPTYGRVSRAGIASLSWSLDHAGPLTKTAEDAAICLQWLAGYDPRDPGSADRPVDDYLSGIGQGIKDLRIGVPRNYFFDHVDRDVEQAVRKAIGALESAGAVVVEIEIPLADQIEAVEFGLCLPEATSYHRETLRTRRDLYEPDVRTFLEIGELVPATDYIAALRVREIMKHAWKKLFASIDALIGPAVTSPATKRGEAAVTWPDGTVEPTSSVFVRLSAPANVTGLPSVAVPCGFAANKLPVAFQIIGAPFAEAKILRIAHAYQGMTDWHSRKPPI